MKNLDKTKKLFKRLEKAHRLYEVYWDYPNKLKEIETKVEPLLKELKKFGISREFSNALLVFGGEAILREPLPYQSKIYEETKAK